MKMLQFLCSKCEQLLECEAEYAGQDTACPFCQQLTRIPKQPPPLSRMTHSAAATFPPASRPRPRFQRAALAVLIGAGLGFLSVGIVGALVGALVGFLVGWRITAIKSRGGGDGGVAKHFPAAPLGLLLATGAWVLAILVWAWVETRPPGAFHDQGGMVITFAVLPLYLGCWVVGGPVALALGHQGMNQIQGAARPSSERWMARSAVTLSRALIFAGLGLLVVVLFSEFSR